MPETPFRTMPRTLFPDERRIHSESCPRGIFCGSTTIDASQHSEGYYARESTSQLVTSPRTQVQH